VSYAQPKHLIQQPTPIYPTIPLDPPTVEALHINKNYLKLLTKNKTIMPVNCKCSACEWVETIPDIDNRSEVDINELRMRNCDNRCNSKIYTVSIV
jgi:hypothetical protein